jgi:hypothetical protein
VDKVLSVVLWASNAFQQALPQRHDGLIGRYKEFLRAIHYRAHRDRKDRILLFNTAEARPIPLHRSTILEHLVVPGGAEPPILLIPEPLISKAQDPNNVGPIDRLAAGDDEVCGGLLSFCGVSKTKDWKA